METKNKEQSLVKPKMRIQLMDKEMRCISDRLVDQSIELMQGPKEKHDGPLRLEVNLTSNLDVENLKKYLDTLVGSLPIKEIGTRGRPSTTSSNELNSPREDIYNDVELMVKKGKTQDQIIQYLRSLGFVFILTEDLFTYFPPNLLSIKEKHIGKPNENGQYPDSYNWMIRCIKRAKDPKSDKFDPQIMFGFHILNEPSNKFVGYLYKDFKGILRAGHSSKNQFTFNDAKELTKMPKYMTEEERLKFSSEFRQLLLNSTKKPSKFFIRWYKDIIFPESVKPSLEKIIQRLDKKE